MENGQSPVAPLKINMNNSVSGGGNIVVSSEIILFM